MPILDPSIQYSLIKDEINEQIYANNGYSFFLKCLINASRNLYQSYLTIEASNQFKLDLEKCISFVNDEFECNFTYEDDFENQNISDYYKYLFDSIKRSDKLKESKKNIGIYKICNDKFNTRLYQPSIFFSEYHSWYLSDTPIAILSLNSNNFKSLDKEDDKKNRIFQFIKLEIDLMKAVGLTLVLCYNGLSNTKSLIYKIIEDDQFSELHINIFEKDFLIDFLKFMRDRFISKHLLLNGYIYLYSFFFEEKSEYLSLINDIKEIPTVTVISFSMKPKDALIKVDFLHTKPFPYYKTGFNSKYLRIYLSFVPIYNKDQNQNKQQVFTNKISGLSLCYISPDDFLFLKNKQINALFDEENHYTNCLLNFEDIHYVRPDLFVNDTLSLMPTDFEMHKSIKNIISTVSNKFNQSSDVKNGYIHHISLKHYLKCIRRIVYAYTYFKRSIKEPNDKNFTVRKTQIYSVLEACKSFFESDKANTEDKQNGVVYEIKTGEGKSCIVCLIAAVLAIKNITVHIASSNIKLCIRDYLESYEFFKLLRLDSAVLLHSNELPKPKKNFDQNNEFKKNFPDKYFANDLFNNPSRMNFSVCGFDNDNNESESANIIFSTFVNFECFYLHIMDNRPGFLERYFSKCGLLIDEVDSILIDEITTGTIVSREINSYAKEILSYVYKNCGKKTDTIINELKEKFNETDICEEDVEQMKKEIKLVNQQNFQDGKKYLIETFVVKNNRRIQNLISKTVKNVIDIKSIAKDKMKSIFKQAFYDDKSEDDNEEEDGDDDDLDTSKFKQFKRIIPFDYDHKGIPEPNKEFSGFVQQFISIKENMNNLIFKDISINYLYVSHPIFANLYKNIFGLTGTVGNENDKEILLQQYKLITKKVPRHKPNLRVNLPMIVCSGISERNEQIVNDVCSFHENGNPVLVIFQDFNEIDNIERMIYSRENNNIKINVFNGKDDIIKPDIIAGGKGAVTFGTNICGRGTDIKCSSSFPLHVIVSYYTSNTRIMEQAFGRTARNGQIGTCRCICLKRELCQISSLNSNIVGGIVTEADLKSKTQREFIDHYKNVRPWIFEFKIKKQDYKTSIHLEKLKELRISKINVNRIVAYKYKFPVFMTYTTFLKIQAQKIFSIFNCPNCKYTWRIFQKYIREMILQSWSLMIKKFDQKNKFDIENQTEEEFEKYKEKLIDEIKMLNETLQKYLPEKENIDMISTFTHICNCVINEYERKVLKSIGQSEKIYKRFGEIKHTCVQLGFRPYSLLSNSGARITKDNVDDTNFIKDPELSYERQGPDNKFTHLSITERVDDIINLIFQKISSFLSDNFFLKFFVRRTLAGCEFGICFDMVFDNDDPKLNSIPNLLVDKNPILIITIYLWSMFPLLAGILICALVYIASMHKEIFEYISCFPAKIAEKFAKKSITTVINNFIPQAGEFIFEKILKYLDECLKKQLNKLKKTNTDAYNIIREFKNLFDSGDNFKEKVTGLFENKFSIPSLFDFDVKDILNGPLLLQISIDLILLLASFLINFINKKKRIEQSKSDSKEFDSTFDDKDKNETSEKLIEISEKKKEDNRSKVHLNKESINEPKAKEFNTLVNDFINSEKFDLIPSSMKAKVKSKDKKQKLKKFKKSQKENESLIDDDNIQTKRNKYDLNLLDIKNSKKYSNTYFYAPLNIYCRKFTFDISKELFDNISFFSSHEHPVINSFIGYVLKCNESFLLFKTIQKKDLNNGHLCDYANKKFSSLENGMIFAYAISCGFEFLQKHNHDIKYFNPNYVRLEKDIPYIYGLDLEKDKHNVNYLAPEVAKDPNCHTKKANVFSLGLMLYAMSVNFKCDINNFVNGPDIRSNFENSHSFGKYWGDLVLKCLYIEKDKRPTFSEICDNIESTYSKSNMADLYAIIRMLKPFRTNLELENN